MRIEDAIETFGCGFSFTRSFTHKYVFERVDSLWVMRDAPRTRPEYRGEEWLVYGTSPAEAEAIVQANRRGRYAVCVFRTEEEPDAPPRAGWKELGYRLQTTEMFFAHSLARIPAVKCDYEVLRVVDETMANRLAKAAGSRQICPEHLTESPPRLRQYVALDEGEPVAWVRSIVCGNAAWCSNMYVRSTHRRRGIAKALMARMLADDKLAGLTANVLLASRVGAKLYQEVGYDAIGRLLVFMKIRSKGDAIPGTTPE
ncbi:MAG: GNAT family N-acetyltransferase [Fimbriimonadaceae bacterium]